MTLDRTILLPATFITRNCRLNVVGVYWSCVLYGLIGYYQPWMDGKPTQLIRLKPPLVHRRSQEFVLGADNRGVEGVEGEGYGRGIPSTPPLSRL